MHFLLKIGALVLVGLIQRIKSEEIRANNTAIDFQDKYCNNSCQIYYDGCNECECGKKCITNRECIMKNNDHCISCKSNLVWSNCTTFRPITCEELKLGNPVPMIRKCFKKCTCPGKYPYWNGTHCVNATQCNNGTTKNPIVRPINMPTSTRRPTNRPSNIPVVTDIFDEPSTLTIDPTRRPTILPTHRPTTKPSILVTDIFDVSSILTIDPTKKPTKVPTRRPTYRPSIVPTMSQPISARPTINPSNHPSKRPTSNPIIL